MHRQGIVEYVRYMFPAVSHVPREKMIPNYRHCSYTASDKLEFNAGSLEEMTAYRFGSRIAPHYFCPVCGSSLLIVAQGVASVNVRALVGVELDKLALKRNDGASN